MQTIYNAFLSTQTFFILIRKVKRNLVDIYDWDSHDSTCPHVSSSLDITRNANFLLFVQKAALCKAIFNFL